jgi:transcriptional regulator with XRE-family HTH domain
VTPARFRTIRLSLHWGASTVAIRCGYSRSSGESWESGRISVPPQVAAWLEELAAWLEAHPAPGR